MHRRNDVLGISERTWARITGIAVGCSARRAGTLCSLEHHGAIEATPSRL
jgi:hypothetical protein